jgi:3-phenylpropionate/trans-cinnamate dioxygenase ferredoxin subunit
MANEEEWVPVPGADSLEPESVMRVDHAGRTFAIARSSDGDYFAIDGLCTHENIHLAGGIVDGHSIECPKHFGVFDYRTGEAKGPPVCIDLRTYPVRVENGVVFIRV